MRGLPGTIVTLRARVLVPAAAAELVSSPPSQRVATPQHRVAAKLDGDSVTAELTIDHAARYRFAVTSPAGTRSIEATPRTIEAEPDQAPTVQLMAPADPLDVSNLQPRRARVRDRGRLRRHVGRARVGAGKDHGQKPIALGPTGSEPARARRAS